MINGTEFHSLRPAITTGGILYHMEKAIQLDKIYWKKVLDGNLAANPLFLKIIINRMLGKGEVGEDISTEKVLNVIKPYTTVLNYWRNVFDGNENASPESLKLLFLRLLY